MAAYTPDSPLKNDGDLPFGSRVLTISTLSGTSTLTEIAYIADSFEVSRPVKFVPNTNQLDAPSGGVTIQDVCKGTATLQLAATTTVYPHPGDTFSTVVATGYDAENFIISDVGLPEEKGGIKKVKVSFTKKYAS